MAACGGDDATVQDELDATSEASSGAEGSVTPVPDGGHTMSEVGLVVDAVGGDASNENLLSSDASTAMDQMNDVVPPMDQVNDVVPPMDQVSDATSDLSTVDAGAMDSPIDAPVAPTYSVGGSISGLVGTVEVTNNGGDSVTRSADGGFTFAVRLLDTAPYAVAVKTQPLGQFCDVVASSGTVTGADVTLPRVTCRKAAVAIDEVHARPASAPYGDANGDGVVETDADEFVEVISNETVVTLDLAGWTLKTGGATLNTRFTFPAATTLAPGARAVIFGGGTPTASFGGARTFVAGGLTLADAPAGMYNIELDGGTLVVDSFAYDASIFGTVCTKTCASVTRSPEGTGSFVAHNTVSGSAGILWSPGVAANQAVAKLSPLMGTPRIGASGVNVLAPVTMQFNMFMLDLGASHISLFASTCAAGSNPVTSFTAFGTPTSGDTSQVLLIPMAPLAFGTTHCLRASGVHSANNVAFDTSVVDYQWTTRTAASARASSVVISEFGGVKFGAGTGGNNEFVELYNPAGVAADISGWFVQRRSAGGTATCYATIPAATTLAAGQFFLIGGPGYTAVSNGGVAADLATASTALTGSTESVLLISQTGNCTGTASVVDAVSVEVTGGPMTDAATVLALPPLLFAAGDGKSVERKACYNSLADASATGMLTSGGHEGKGNGERIGSSNADFVGRTANPQSTTTLAEPYGCP